MRKNEIVTKIEDSIKETAKQFDNKKDGAFYFRNESDIQCRLFTCISQNIDDPELVHAEQRINNSRSWHDLVIWKPEMKSAAVSNWDKYTGKFADSLPEINLAVIETKHLYGKLDKARKYIDVKSICNQSDIKNLMNRVESDCRYAYFVMFWDENVRSNEEYYKCLENMKKAFTEFRKKKKIYKRIRVLCKTRDGEQFKLGF